MKPNVDPSGIFSQTDYSTSLKVSAYGVSVCAPDLNGNVHEKEHFFWVYTDFYKWSLVNPKGKWALVVNVFADSSFGRRNEFVFRHPEAKRLATAIEFFIEKFMTVMHIGLELSTSGDTNSGKQLTPRGTQQLSPRSPRDTIPNISNEPVKRSMLIYADEDWPTTMGGGNSGVTSAANSAKQEDLLGMDLLDLNDDSSPMVSSRSNNGVGVGAGGSYDFFNSANNLPNPPLQSTSSNSGFLSSKSSASVDFLDLDSMSTPVTTPTTVFAATTIDTMANPFDDDDLTFHPDVTSIPIVPQQQQQQQPKMALPLTPIQLTQHQNWLQMSMLRHGGPLYDDGVIQIASKVEIKGSQGRLTLYYRNLLPTEVTNLETSITDPGGLIRSQMGSIPTVLGVTGQCEQQIIIECLKPAFPSPSLHISYENSICGKRIAITTLPLSVASFNEPLVLNNHDFSLRWDQLNGHGQEAVDVFTASKPLIPSQVLAALTNVSINWMLMY